MSTKEKWPSAFMATEMRKISFTPEEASAWTIPLVQRQLTVNGNVHSMAERIRDNDGVVPGVLTFAVLNKIKYLVDGQHRRESFLRSGCPVGYADTMTRRVNGVGELGQMFADLNSQIVRMRPDDFLRAMEGAMPYLAELRKEFKWIGYDAIRRGSGSPVVSMSIALRSHAMARVDTMWGHHPALCVAEKLTRADTDNLRRFLTVASEAWGIEETAWKLWNPLNLSICMWLFHRVVLRKSGDGVSHIDSKAFGKCIAVLAASERYLGWLKAKVVSSPEARRDGYRHVYDLLTKQHKSNTGQSLLLPRPEWAYGPSA